uniref:C-type lectin domain-containing protein n=1 Tax=Acrobeloides nanus TaxID=290746 RepID=A0A914EMZ6_9BILA
MCPQVRFSSKVPSLISARKSSEELGAAWRRSEELGRALKHSEALGKTLNHSEALRRTLEQSDQGEDLVRGARKPTLDGSWKPTTSKDYTKLEYFEFNNVSTPKIGYRAKDQVAWNQRIPPVLGDSPVNTPDNQKWYPIINSNASCVVLNPNDGSWTNQACDIPQCYICSY